MLKEVIVTVVKRIMPALVACLLPALLIYADLVINRQCTESGLIEGSQALALLIMSIMLAWAARRRADLRGGLVLAAGMFATMFIRENDQLLDEIRHGCWVVPAAITVAVSFLLAWRSKETIFPSIRKICENHHFPLLAIGFFVTTVFSRIFGMKPIWQTVVGMDDYRPAKHVAEEGGELLGYAIMFIWAVCFVGSLIREGRKDSTRV